MSTPQTRQPQRLRRIDIEPEFLLELLKIPVLGEIRGNERVECFRDRIPDSATAIRAHINEHTGNIMLVVQDSSYSEISEGCEIPRVEPRYTREPAKVWVLSGAPACPTLGASIAVFTDMIQLTDMEQREMDVEPMWSHVTEVELNKAVWHGGIWGDSGRDHEEESEKSNLFVDHTRRGYFYMPLPKCYDSLQCPWCDTNCMHVEYENWAHFSNDDQLVDDWYFRIYPTCKSWQDAYDGPDNDANGNDYGRGEWANSVDDAVANWMQTCTLGLASNQKGVW